MRLGPTINHWISVLLCISSVERADLEYFNSHVSDVVSLMVMYDKRRLFERTEEP